MFKILSIKNATNFIDNSNNNNDKKNKTNQFNFEQNKKNIYFVQSKKKI